MTIHWGKISHDHTFQIEPGDHQVQYFVVNQRLTKYIEDHLVVPSFLIVMNRKLLEFVDPMRWSNLLTALLRWHPELIRNFRHYRRCRSYHGTTRRYLLESLEQCRNGDSCLKWLISLHSSSHLYESLTERNCSVLSQKTYQHISKFCITLPNICPSPRILQEWEVSIAVLLLPY